MARKNKKSQYEVDIIKAIHIASRNEQFARNGGGQWVAVNRPHKNKKKYDRNQKKKEVRNQLLSFSFLSSCSFSAIGCTDILVLISISLDNSFINIVLLFCCVKYFL